MTGFVAPAEDRQRAAAAPSAGGFVAPAADRALHAQATSGAPPVAPPATPTDAAVDVAQSLPSGVVRGTAQLAGLPGDARDAQRGAISAVIRTVAPIFGHQVSSEQANALADITSRTINHFGFNPAAMAAEITDMIPGVHAPNSQQTVGATERAAANIGVPLHTPTTQAGQYAEAIGEFAPAALIPGGGEANLATRIGRAVIPAVASETAGELTHGTPYEGAARTIGAFAGAGLNEASIGANARRAALRAPNAQATALENEFGPLTAGERSGNPGQRLEEDDFRRSIGGDRAQAIVQAFDDRRAPQIRQNVMGIATRGQEPLSEDIGGAGTTVADALRSRMDQMRTEQSNLYKQAFDRSQNEPVAPTDELTNNVDRTINENFLDVPQARAVIDRLHGQMSQGNATYATVERARQALNRQLGTALRAGDRDAAFGINSVIDQLDAFVAPRLSPEASRAVTEARGFTHEMMNSLGERTRTDLATGHVGTSDPGGRAIERVLNNDLTGEQVIDGILGGNKPSAQTLGAVRRIREINDSIQYTNRDAASGARVPGRVKVGGQTAGERRFAADSADSRYGVELPKDELQGLREGLFHRILRPIDVRNRGAMIPAQTMVSNLRRAIDGPGKEITAQLFTPREIAAMRRAADYMERIVPPTGGAQSGTTPAIGRMIARIFDKLMGAIPGVGPVMREAFSEANSTGRARAATRPTPPPSARPPARIYRPSAAAPAIAGMIGAARAQTLQPQQSGTIRVPQ